MSEPSPTTEPSSTPESTEPKPAAHAGRGAIAIAGAKVWFIVTSYAVQLALPNLLADAAEFGLYRGTMSLVSVLNNVMIVATLQAVSKHVSEDEPSTPALLRQALRIQLVTGGLLASVLFFGAGPLAKFFVDASLEGPVRIASGVLFFNALYGALVGTLNGRRRFLAQASLDATFSTLRTVGIVGGAVLFASAYASLGGWAASVAGITTIAFLLLRRELFARGGGALPLSRWLGFMAPLWLYQVFLNGMLLLDVQVLKKSLGELGLAAGLPAAEAAEAASTQVGYYGAAQTFALVPYQLILSLTFIVFPMISRAIAAGDAEAARNTLRNAMRISLLALLAIAAPVVGASDGVMRIAYREEYLVGAPALAILIVGVVFFTLFVLCSTALSSAGRPGLAALLAAVGVVVVLVAGSLLVASSGGGSAALPAMALGTSLGMTLSFVLAGIAVWIRFRALLPPLSVLRALVAAGLAGATAHFVPHGSRFTALAALAAGFFVYLGVLFALREVRLSELAALRRRR
ncbi:MAG: oligosaccharide flippase family protein [Sandaracinus sp.]|nr:oligosaccharide flippase family protein [Sandaracinus sp.]